MGAFILMVEMAVIETASENLFLKLSTSVVYLLSFPTGQPTNRHSFQ